MTFIKIINLFYSVYHRNKKDEVFDKVSQGRLDVVISTLETAKLKIVIIFIALLLYEA